MIKSSSKYSVICGVFLLGIFWVSEKFGSSPLLNVGHFFFDLVIFFVFIYFASREYKTYHNDGFLHFWQGMSIAFIVYLPAAVIFSGALLLILKIDPSLMANYREGAMAFLAEQKEVFLETFSQQEYQEQIEALNKVTDWDLVASSFLKKLLAGFLVTPVVSVILRKKPNWNESERA